MSAILREDPANGVLPMPTFASLRERLLSAAQRYEKARTEPEFAAASLEFEMSYEGLLELGFEPMTILRRAHEDASASGVPFRDFRLDGMADELDAETTGR